jgi:hypothetical protein
LLSAIFPTGEGIVADPQDQIKKWLSDNLTEKGHKSHAELAERLHVSIDAVRRMRNRDGTKESRRIEAHHIPLMAEYFGNWPPGYPMSKETEAAKESARTDRKVTVVDAAKEVVAESVEGDVTIIDKSVNVAGDGANIGSVSAPNLAAKNLMGALNIAIDEIYRSAGTPITLSDLGGLALEHHAMIVALCENEEEYPYAMEIMKIRLKKQLEIDKDGE